MKEATVIQFQRRASSGRRALILLVGVALPMTILSEVSGAEESPSPQSAGTPQPAAEDPFLVPVPGHPGFYTYPGEPNRGTRGGPCWADLRGYAPGTVVQSPTTHKHYRVPLDQAQTRKP